MGHELNPRIGSFDIKFFCEMRPGLIGWVMLDVIFLVKSYQEYGEINLPLAFVTISQALYVADGLWLEVRIQMSRVIKKRLFAYAKTKTEISCAVIAQLISAFVFTK